METVIAAEWIASQAQPPEHVADIGAGCGVFGLELLHYFERSTLDAFELQPEFASFFETNRCNSPHPNNIRLHLGDIRTRQEDDHYSSHFDMIVANIPFFDPQGSKLSNDKIKNNCRFLLNGGIDDFLGAIDKMLISDGAAFVLARPEVLQKASVPADLEIQSRVTIRKSVLVNYKKQRLTNFRQ